MSSIICFQKEISLIVAIAGKLISPQKALFQNLLLKRFSLGRRNFESVDLSKDFGAFGRGADGACGFGRGKVPDIAANFR